MCMSCTIVSVLYILEADEDPASHVTMRQERGDESTTFYRYSTLKPA